MRKYAKWGLSALALLCAFSLGRGDNAYSESDLARAREEAYNSGYQTGYSEGTLSNQEALYTEAFSEGRLKGYDEGLNEGLLQGAAQGQNTALTAAGDTYTQGYDEGYAQGYAKKEKDDQAARDRYLTSLQASLPVVTPTVDTTGSDRSLPTTEPDEEPTSHTVYVTKSGTKYHLGSCSHLSKSKIEKSLSEAKNAGFEPCKTCNPPK